jgi:phage terminase large subunit
VSRGDDDFLHRLTRGIRNQIARRRDLLVPPAFQVLQERARYIVLYGGRNGGKSWSIVRTLLDMAAETPLRILCCREIMASIRESSFRLLVDQIRALGLEEAFTVASDRIIGRNGSEFIFEGLFHNISKIRSYEGINICWVEEAQNVSEASWVDLIPTIRTPGSRFFISFNPMHETDPVYVRFVKSERPDVLPKRVSWRDNPYHSAEMEAERLWLLKTDPDAHAHVWEGEFQAHSDAQIFHGKWSVEAFEPQPGWSGPYFGCDWGFSQDPTVLMKSWVYERSLYVEAEAWAVKCDNDKLPALFRRIDGSDREIIRADSARPDQISHMQKNGFPRITACEKGKGSVEDGIAHMRSYERIVVHPSCTHTEQEMRLYSYKVDKLSGNVMADVVDKNNHCIDALRYALEPLMKKKGATFFDAAAAGAFDKFLATAVPSQYPLPQWPKNSF